MKEIYSRIYEELYYNYPNNYYPEFLHYSRRFEFNLIRSIRTKIEKSTNEDKLRADAKYFLLVNFHELVLKPILEGEYYGEVTNENELLKNIEDDIQNIISTTINVEENREGKISGHKIIGTINMLWRELKTTRIGAWGNDE